ncbi:MAG TPA: glycoside hydrolase family 3 N-terminal domain-containing protein [Phycisphaerae bacterium]|nr:glycoside hydrolase family 3 N-terminal domain-containing protein [Phycisphaerae bacterium]
MIASLVLAALISLPSQPPSPRPAETTIAPTSQKETPAYLDPSRLIDERVADLVGRMTLEEKVSQMVHDSPAIDRLNVPAYNWWSEGLHGVARAGRATVFPQAIGLGATFDEDLVYRVASCISDEARAMYQEAVRRGFHRRYCGLTFWSPNVNIFRDPRWGRGQETYGEDPWLTARLGTAFVRGLQGDHPKYLKTAACAKHFAVHSGPEGERSHFNAVASPKDLRETYLPAFKALVESGVAGVMCAYNATNGQPCCANKPLLVDILRDEWRFQGYIVSDCWAMQNLRTEHKVVAEAPEGAALAANAGVNLDCGEEYPALAQAVPRGLVNESRVDELLSQLLRVRFRLGLFDPPEANPYTRIPPDVIHSPQHQTLAREAAQKSIVLLKNNGVLPLRKDTSWVYVTGPTATSIEALLGNYYGVSDNMVTILEGIAGKPAPGGMVKYHRGCLLRDTRNPPITAGEDAARRADVTIAVMGITGIIEGEEGESLATLRRGDRDDLGLPAGQLEFLKKLRNDNQKPIVVVLTGGSPICSPELHDLADAVLFVWYPGEQGGTAVADVLFGDVAPAGRLPVTFPKSAEQIPPFEDYAMQGRTYRYMKEEPLYPFGFGLSYTTFTYSDLKLTPDKIGAGGSSEATVSVTNTGNVAGDEVVQLYLRKQQTSDVPVPWALRGFRRVSLKPQEHTTVRFALSPDVMMSVDDAGRSILEPGHYEVLVGGSSPSPRSQALGSAKPVTAGFMLTPSD